MFFFARFAALRETDLSSYVNSLKEVPMRYYLCLLSILCISITVNAGEMRTPGKPRPPVQISISPVNTSVTPADIKPGDTVEFKVAASSRIEAQKMEIKVDLIGGAELVSGETEWSGPIAKNGEKSLIITVRAPFKGHGRIKAKAVIPVSEGTSFAAAASYTLGEEEKKEKARPPAKKDSKGRDIREYKVK